MSNTQADITQLLHRWREQDKDAEAELMQLAYPVFKDIAKAQLRKHHNLVTLCSTEIANEAYLKLASKAEIDWHDRNHFFAMAATITRHLVIDYIRSKNSQKRGGDIPFVSFGELQSGIPSVDESIDWLGIDQAITELELNDQDAARLVELKIFAGMTNKQIADVLNCSEATIKRRWRFTRTWLSRYLMRSENE